MTIFKTTLIATMLTAASFNAHAGIWDSITGFFSGSDDKAAQEATVQEAVLQETKEQPSTENKPSKIETGLKLIPLLTQNLGVSERQANGGMGSILQAAQVLMSGSDFGKLSGAIPSANALLAAAPKTESGSGLMDSAIEMAGKKSGTVKAGLDLVSQFKSLGMGADMIPKFSEVAQGYLKQSDTPESSDLLATALSGI